MDSGIAFGVFLVVMSLFLHKAVQNEAVSQRVTWSQKFHPERESVSRLVVSNSL